MLFNVMSGFFVEPVHYEEYILVIWPVEIVEWDTCWKIYDWSLGYQIQIAIETSRHIIVENPQREVPHHELVVVQNCQLWVDKKNIHKEQVPNSQEIDVIVPVGDINLIQMIPRPRPKHIQGLEEILERLKARGISI